MSEFFLKILSGNHIGAEIPLGPGQYSLGNSESCDLVLSDDSLHDTELVVQITPEGQLNIFPKREEAPVYHNGLPLDNPFSIAPFDVVTTSNLFFTLGPAEAEWPSITLPKLQDPTPDPNSNDSESEETGDELPDVDLDDDDLDNLELDEGLDSPFTDEETEPSDAGSARPPLPKISKKLLIGIPAGLITVMIALVVVLLLSSDTTEITDPEVKVITFEEQAVKIRDALNQKHVRIKTLPDDSIMLSGYTATQNDKQSLQRSLTEQDIPFSSQLVVMNELRANADAILQQRGYQNIRLELDTSPGSLVMTGYVTSVEELTNLITLLKQEVHGLVSIVDQVENQSSRLSTLKSMLREKNLSARIHLVQKPNLITVEGHLLDDEQVYNLNNVVTRFRKRYGNNPVLKIATRSANKQQDTVLLPTLRIRGVSMGKVPYVIMEDGGKYLVGAKLTNGYIIEDINIDYLLLLKGTERVKYRLGGSHGGSKQ